ncbi:pectin acetylesterase 8 isoform X2 [Capsicum annuum]|uniref:pectin acetylesterase 8 isoform X2 n=1 Tax=Capsicum annuum TaxID=4072 RepID=UPI001FB08AB3|nr:pectin acetylesterase 8 isoform X2 [Capsicum annuum]
MMMANLQFFCLLVCSLAIIKTGCAKDNWVEKTIVKNAISKGAVCLDGSPPAYHFQSGFGEGVENWIVQLSATNLHFRGARIFEAVMDELLAKGLKNAKNALLSGTSAGGYPTMLYCDHFRSLMPKSKRVKCFADAGHFIHAKNPKQARGFEEVYNALVTLQGSAKALPKECTSKMNPVLCFFPENILQHIKTPIFIAMSAYDYFQVNKTLGHDIFSCIFSRTCTSSQNKTLREFRSEFLTTLPKPHNPKLKGVFIDSFVHHSAIQWRWTIQSGLVVNNVSAPEAFADWYFDRKYWYVIDKKDLPTIPK